MLKTPEEFAAIPLRTNPDGSVVRVGDIGRAELGAEDYSVEVDYDGKPSTAWPSGRRPVPTPWKPRTTSGPR